MTPFNVYREYIALKSHFNSDYDYFKYNGVTRTTKRTYDKRKDKYFFSKIARKYNDVDVVRLFLANFIDNENSWVGNIANNQEVESSYINWLRRVESLQYIFEKDFNTIIEPIEGKINFMSSFTTEANTYPPVIMSFLRSEISIESLIILDEVLGFLEKLNEKHVGDLMWDQLYFKCKKYRCFLSINRHVYFDIMSKIVKERA